MSGKRKKPLYKRFFSRRVKSHGGHRALAAMTAILGLIMMSFGFVSAPALATGGGGNEDCPPGTTQLAKYEWKGSGYQAESGGSIVSVSGNATSGTFTVADGYEVSAVVVKGSNNAKTVTFDPPVTSGSFNNSGLVNNGGQTADISNVKFCGGEEEPEDQCPDGSNPGDLNGDGKADEKDCGYEPPVEPEGDITVTSDCESITINPPTGVKPADGKIVILLDGKDARPETWTVEPGEHTVELYVNGELVDSVTVTVKECPPPPPSDENDGLCHATGSGKYVLIENISSAGIFNGHYGEGRGDHQDGEDIIPPFTYQGQSYSQNWDAAGQAIYNNGCKVESEPEGKLKVSSTCESITFSSEGVKPEGAEQVFKLDGVTKAPGTYPVAPGSHTVELWINGKLVDTETITVEECETPPELIVTVIPNQGSCEARTPKAQVTTSFASSIAYQVTGQERVFVHREVQAGTYMVTLPDVAEGSSVSYDIVVVPLDDSAKPIVKGPFTFSVPANCDEVPPCIEFQDENPNAPCYVEREPDVREKSSERESCKLGGVVTTHAVFTTTYSFNEVTQQWESSETATSSQSFDPYTAAELKEKGCVKAPPPDDDNPPSDHPTNPPHAGATSGSSSLSSNLMVGAGGTFLMAALIMLFGARRRQVGEV